MSPSLILLLDAINRVRTHKHQAPLARIDAATRLREDCGFDSMDLAELTVVVEERTGVDLFADASVRTVGEAAAKIEKAEKLKL